MTRKEIYAEVKKYGLAELILNECGDNYTRIPNLVLLEYVKIAKNKIAKKSVKVEKPSSKELSNLKNAFVELIAYLSNYRVISVDKASEILGML